MSPGVTTATRHGRGQGAVTPSQRRKRRASLGQCLPQACRALPSGSQPQSPQQRRLCGTRTTWRQQWYRHAHGWGRKLTPHTVADAHGRARLPVTTTTGAVPQIVHDELRARQSSLPLVLYTTPSTTSSLASHHYPWCCTPDRPRRARLPVTTNSGAAVVVECVLGGRTVADIHKNRSLVNSRTACSHDGHINTTHAIVNDATQVQQRSRSRKRGTGIAETPIAA